MRPAVIRTTRPDKKSNNNKDLHPKLHVYVFEKKLHNNSQNSVEYNLD